jgi:hypothetical protein
MQSCPNLEHAWASRRVAVQPPQEQLSDDQEADYDVRDVCAGASDERPPRHVHMESELKAIPATGSLGTPPSARTVSGERGDGARADCVGSLEVGDEDVEQLGAGPGAERVQALAKPALELVGPPWSESTPVSCMSDF